MSVLRRLINAGLTVRAEEQRVIVKPAARLTDELRSLVFENRAELLAELQAAHEGALRLVAAINECCDMRGDDDHNQAGLIRETQELFPEQKEDMRQHFDEQARIWAKATGRQQ